MVESGGLASPRLVCLGQKNHHFVMHYVYVLLSENAGRLYKGSTADLKKRLLEHKTGKVKSTKDGRPWKLIYYEAFLNKRDALLEERFLKSGKGRERLKYILKNLLEGCPSGLRKRS